MVVLCCIVVVTGFLPFPVSRSSLSSPPSQVKFQGCRFVSSIYIFGSNPPQMVPKRNPGFDLNIGESRVWRLESRVWRLES